MKTLIILGAGGYGRTIADLAEQAKLYDDIKFLDDNGSSEDVIGGIADFKKYISSNTVFYPAIGDNELRCELLHRIEDTEGNLASIIHRTAYISPTAKIGSGVAVLPNASVGTNVIINAGCIINMNTVIDHDTILEEGVHIAPGAIVKGNNKVAKYSKIESGTVVERGQCPV